VLKSGTDATIIAAGPIDVRSVAGPRATGAEGISLRVINMHTIKPLDEEAVLSAAREQAQLLRRKKPRLLADWGVPYPKYWPANIRRLLRWWE